jgi:hypothetical protein
VGASGQDLKSLDPPVLLPDGAEFKTWEAPLKFTRTWYVDGSNPKASDENPGTEAQPFATINRAAQVAGPGERVLVAAGVYRERISPAQSGTGPDQMISYEAAPGARVVLKGSRVFHEPWVADDSSISTRIWRARLEPEYFTGYNPFDTDNVTARQFAIMDFAALMKGRAPANLPRGLVFQDGRRLNQVGNRSALNQSQGCYWVDRTNQVLYATFFDNARPEQALVEITTQETIFAPENIGLGYIRVKGFVVEQAAGPFPWEQVGAISTTRGHHWIIEDNTVRQVNGVGIDVGIQLFQWPQPPSAGFHIVRRNRVSDCGICGIAGMGNGSNFGLLIEDNLLQRNAFHPAELLFETAGIKTHLNVHNLIRRNLILDTLHGSGIWMDWDNRNSRCCQNIVVNANSGAGAIFVEASYVPNLIDQNVVWGTRGPGIYEHDSCRQIFAHNLVGRCTSAGLNLHGQMTTRRIGDHEPEYGLHQVSNNLLFRNGWWNVFAGKPSKVTGNVSDGMIIAFDRDKLELTLSATNLPACELMQLVNRDFFGNPRRGPNTIAGPFALIASQPTVIKLWRGPMPDAVNQ